MDVVARLKVNGQNFSAELGKVLGDAERRFGNTGSVIGRNLGEGVGGGLQQAASRVPVLGGALSALSGTALVTAAGLGAVSIAMASGIAEAEGYEGALRGLDAVLKATGNNTGFARGELVAFANDMEGAWAVSAEAIMDAEKVLSSFDGVAGSVFNDAIARANDMAAVYGGDLTSNTEKLGTVLQNLAQGEVAGLSKGFKFLGVETLTTIENLAKTGETAEAQRALLAALEQRVGGAGEAKAGGLSGAFFRLSDAIGDATRAAATSSGTYQTSITWTDALAEKVNKLADSYDRIGFSRTMGSLWMGLGLPQGKGPAGPEKIGDDPYGLNRVPGLSMNDIVARSSADRAYSSAEVQRKAEQARKDAETAAKKQAATDKKAAEEEARNKKELHEAEVLAWEKIKAKTKEALETPINLRDTLADLEKANKEIAEDYRREMRAAVEDVADILTGLIGGKAGRIVGDLFSLAGGGRAGNPALDMLFKGGVKAMGNTGINGADKTVGAVDKLVKKQEGLFGLSGEFTQTLSRVLAGAGVGAAAGGLVGSSKTAQFGAMAGGALGQEAGKMLGNALGSTLGGFAGPLGSIAGGLIGGALGSALKKVKWGASTVSFSDGAFSAGDATGNSGSAKKAASASANSVVGSLESLIEQLGGRVLSAPSLTIGQRHGDYRVNTSGTSLKIAKGAMEFDDDQQAAVEYAIKTMLTGAVIDGISEASKNILKSGNGELEELVRKAGLIESIPKNLKARLDPVGAAIDAVVDKWEEIVAALREGGAGAEQMAQAQKLYNMELEDAKTGASSASAGLKAFRDTLDMGSAANLSLSDQEAKARGALQPYLDKIDTGGSIDQEGYQTAAQRYLDVARERYGSTSGYFAAFDQIQAATGKAISTIDNAVPIGAPAADPFAMKTATATQTSAELLAQQSGQLSNIEGLLQQIANGGGIGMGAFIGAARGF
ncbi:hypothetical protein O4H52_03065 [Sphingomonadaceae bacterium G21617-S1]|nr:hypothetical protein [Sphingomonadaceae bacterium G21617-S1]